MFSTLPSLLRLVDADEREIRQVDVAQALEVVAVAVVVSVVLARFVVCGIMGVSRLFGSRASAGCIRWARGGWLFSYRCRFCCRCRCL